MDLTKIYKYIILGLVGLNVAILVFFLKPKPRPRHQPPNGNFQSEVIEMLHLNNQQASTLRVLADGHKQQIEKINERQGSLLISYFESLDDTLERVNKDSLLNHFQQSEKEKIEMTYQHFQDIKELLNDEQLPYFELFMSKTTERLLLNRTRRSPPPRNFD
ncbi:MAG: hypothetical protein Sapg2KO_44280 [Saprospiraceae bacterium]